MRFSIILSAIFAATAIAVPAANPEAAAKSLKVRFYEVLQARHCVGGNDDNICGEGYFYVGRSFSPCPKSIYLDI